MYGNLVIEKALHVLFYSLSITPHEQLHYSSQPHKTNSTPPTILRSQLRPTICKDSSIVRRQFDIKYLAIEQVCLLYYPYESPIFPADNHSAQPQLIAAKFQGHPAFSETSTAPKLQYASSTCSLCPHCYDPPPLELRCNCHSSC